MELISVIVPVYNAEKFLFRCVDSICNQTYTDLEIILINDGSPDDSPKMCDDMAKKDPRIKVIHKLNAGQGLARNDGLNIATGNYVTFVDSDDWIAPDHIENLYIAIKKYDADISLGNHIKVSSDGTLTSRMLLLNEGVYEKGTILTEIMLPLIGADVDAHRDVLINSSVWLNMYKMDFILNNNIRFISERFAVAEDFYFNLDCFHFATKVVYTKEKGYYYFQNSQSTCEKYNPKRFERTLNYYDLVSQRINSYGLSDKIGFRMYRSFLMKIRVAIRHIVLSDLSRKEKFKQIREILSNDRVQKVLQEYPIESYSFSMRLLMKQMRKKSVKNVYYLMYFREKGRRNKGARSFLRAIGIGR